MFWLNINVNVSLISFEHLKSSQRKYRHLDTQGSQSLGHLGTYPVDIGCKLNVHKTFRRRLLNVLCTFNLRPVSMEQGTRALKALRHSRHFTQQIMFDWVLNAPLIQEILRQRCYHHQPDSTHMSKISHSLFIPKRRCSIKKLILKISQYFQENICVEVSF